MPDTNKVGVTLTYSISSFEVVELPEGKTWDDVESWFVKWGYLHYLIKGETEHREVDAESLAMENIDTKYPLSVEITELDEDDFDTGHLLDSFKPEPFSPTPAL